MAIQHANRGIVKKDLQLYYNREFIKSFRGEATTNIVSNTTDFSGLSYAGYSTEWTSDPTRFTKTYNSNLQTPIGTGATLLTESGTAGYHHLSRLGGGGTGGHSISCYVFPVNGNIGNFAIGMLGDSASTALFNLVDGTVASTGVRVSNAFITKVPGWKGWYRAGANIGGREGGWVGAVGLNVEQPITPTPPYKSMYVTGLQYEDTKTYCTPFVNGSRTANTVAGGGGLLDISGNNINADLTNVSFDSSGYIFAGSQYVNVSSLITGNQSFSWGAWIYPTATGTPVFFGNASAGLAMVSYWDSANNKVRVGTWGFDRLTSGTTILPSNWGYTFWTWDGTTLTSYTNGIADGTATGFSFNISNLYTTIGNAVNAQYFTGRIAQTLVYNRALSAAEVLQNFNATRKTYGL